MSTPHTDRTNKTTYMDDPVQVHHQVLAIDDVWLIRTRLLELKATHPQLLPIIKKIPSDCSITSDFIQTYFESNVDSSVKSLVLRALLGDPAMYPKGAASSVGLHYYRRIAQYFEHHPKQPLVRITPDFTKDDIPTQLESVFGIFSASSIGFLSQFGLIPYLMFSRGHLPAEGYLGLRIKRTDDLNFLRSFYESRKISKELCERFLSGEQQHHIPATYFDTGDKALDLRNILFLLKELWRFHWKRGRLHSKIPKVIFDYFKLSRLSVKELAFLIDILPLVYAGCMDRSCLSPEDDVLGILPVLDNIKGSEIEDLEPLILALGASWLMNSESAENLYEKKEQRARERNYDASFYFNMHRVLTSSTAQRLAPYYSVIDDGALKRQVNNHYKKLAPAFADQLSHIQKSFPEEFKGIRTRDLSNILFYLWHHTRHGRDRRRILPPIAKFAVGSNSESMRELKPTSDSRLDLESLNKGSPTEERLPLFATFFKALGKCYLLYPGYQGPIPEDGPIYMPRSVAGIFSERPSFVILSGPKDLPWGQDPYDKNNLPEVTSFDSIIPLQA